jgi:hypothetical protein
MNEELKTAGLLSDGPQDVDDYDKTYAGFLGQVVPVPLGDADDLLAIGFGIYTGGFCNIDTTVALYRREPFQMVTILNAERSYAHGFWLREIAVAREDPDRTALIASGWVASNCTSTWNGNIFRIDRVKADASVESILNEGASAQLGAEFKIDIENDTVTFSYITAIINWTVSRAAIERYQIQGSRFTRIAPICSVLWRIRR